MDQNTSQNYLGHIKFALITAEKKMKEAKEVSLFLFFFYFVNIYFKLTLVILQLHSHEL